ncbi:hypothetical protein BYT27DRAFT_7188331 [Phlegmacium glaucopus]|nr:hypothetical protein BYT27DRAFT_7188331 [Phlegmacium glaucopus]
MLLLVAPGLCQRLPCCRVLLNPPRATSGRTLFTLFPRNRGSSSGGPAPEKSSHWQTRLKITGGIIISVVGVYYVSHLEKVPETGRWRFMNTSPKFEAEFAELARKEYLAEFEDATLPTTHPLSRHVLRVASRILSASDLGVVRGESVKSALIPRKDGDVSNSANTTVEWEVIVVNDRKIINALASPGLIVIFTGILPLCRDEEGLAAVLAHEIGHVVARHTAERISSQSIRLLLQSLFQFVRTDVEPTGVISRNSMQLPNSQTQEHEADLIGLRLMSRACYNPQNALGILSRMAHLESKIPSNRNFTFTHPSSVSRVKSLEEALPEGYAIMATNPDCNHVQQQLGEFNDTVHAIKVDRI